MKLLNDPLILKYFGCQDERMDAEPHTLERLAFDHGVAYRILQAMCEPIKKGERYLQLIYGGPNSLEVSFDERVCQGRSVINGPGQIEEYFQTAHMRELRLPDQFQPKRESECGKCDVCGYDYQRYCRQHGMQGAHEKCSEKPDPAEEKIKAIWLEYGGTTIFAEQLRELVELARKS